MPNKYLYVDDLAVFVHHVGPTTLPGTPPRLETGRPIVCIHGTPDNGAIFADVLSELEADHSPLAFDLPGHGRSGGLDALESIEDMAALTRGVLAQLGIERPVLLGQSMGALVALQTALELGADRVSALILVGAAPKVPVADRFVEALRRVAHGKARRDLRPVGFSPQTKPDVIRRAILERLKTDPRVQLGDVLAVQKYDATPRLGEIEAPTLVVTGADMAPDVRGAGADAFLAGLPNARKLEIADAGHALALEQPRALAAAVREHLAEVSR